MAISTQTQNLNLIPGKSAPVVVHCSQGNVGDTVRFYLYDGDEPFYPTNVSIAVHGVRADGSVFGPYAVSVTSGSNLVSFELVTAMTSVNGAAIGELVITDSGENQVGSANFGILVEATPYSSSVTYEDDLSIYQRILAYVQSIPASISGQVTAEANTRQAAIEAERTERTTAISNEATTRANAVSTLESRIAAEETARASADSNLQSQINQIVSPSGEAPSAAEVQNARIGADGVTYTTLGDAIRTQNTKLTNDLTKTSDEIYTEKIVDWEYTFSKSALVDVVFFTNPMSILLAGNSYKIVMTKNNTTTAAELSHDGTTQTLILGVYGGQLSSSEIVKFGSDVGRFKLFANGACTINISIYSKEITHEVTYTHETRGSSPESYYVYCKFPFKKGKRYEIDISFSTAINISQFGLSISTNGYWNTNYTPIVPAAYKGVGVTRRFYCTGDYDYALIRLYSADTSTMTTKIKVVDSINNDGYFIASNDTSEYDKNIADYVCKGTNDEYVINMAYLQGVWEGVTKIRLSCGVFYIQSFGLTDSDTKVAILLQHGLNRVKNMIIEGSGCAYGFTRQKFPNGTVLYVDETGYNSLGGSDVASIIKTPGTQAILSDNAIELREFGIYVYGSQKKITAIDFTSGDRVYCDKLALIGYTKEMLDDYHVGLSIPPVAIPVDGFTGIKMGTGSNDPQGYTFRNIGIWGFYEGFKVGGEHLLMEQCYAALCVYGYTFGNIPEVESENINSLCHPITMINCSDERNQNFPCFKRAGKKQQITMIDLNLEYLPNSAPGNVFNNYMTDETGGEVCGEISYTIFTSQGNVVDIPLWANGNGQTFVSRNAAQRNIGTTTERMTYSPNYGQTYFDTDLGKLMTCTDPQNKTWV